VTPEPNPSNEAVVRVRNGPLVAPVLARVVGMLAARAQCPVDRLDDALLVADALAAHAQSHTVDGHVTVALTAETGGLELRLTELERGGARAVLSDASLPGVGNVLERIADEVRVDDGGEADALYVRIAFDG
jgi:hypothetical protein